MLKTILDSQKIYIVLFDSGLLQLNFQDGSHVSYSDVPEGEYLELIGSLNPDQYYETVIKGDYPLSSRFLKYSER